MLTRSAAQRRSSPRMMSFPSRESSRAHGMTIMTTDLPAPCSSPSIPMMEPDASVEPMLEQESLTPLLPQDTSDLSFPPPQRADFSQFKWNEAELNELHDDEWTTEDEEFLEELDINCTLLDDAMAICVAIHSPGKPKMIDIPASPSCVSAMSDYSSSSSSSSSHTSDQENNSSSSSYFSQPMSLSESRSSDLDQDSDYSQYSPPLTLKHSASSFSRPFVNVAMTTPQTHQNDMPPMDTDAIEALRSQYTLCGAVFTEEHEDYDQAKMVARGARERAPLISLPPHPKDASTWKAKTAKAAVQMRKKSMSATWFK